MRGRTVTALAVFLAFGLASVSWADVPPPPVNQKLFIPDSVFTNLTETGCEFCHSNPDIVPPPSTVNRHHLKVGQAVPEGSIAPFDPAPDGTYQCLTCHRLECDPVTGICDFREFRDCTYCHKGASPHHGKVPTAGANCQRCHGSVIENPPSSPADPPAAWIPTYDPSLVTPWPSDKPNGGEANARGTQQGNCNYCHDSGVVTDPAFVGPFGPVDPVVTNSTSHHSTGFGADNSKCFWCHDFTRPEDEWIRVCENCHSIPTLHNIQADSPNADNPGMIVPGQEDLGWGHIGNNWDCEGCHGFTAGGASVAPASGPTIPSIGGVSQGMLPAGEEATLVINGDSFMSDNGFMMFSPVVQLECTLRDGQQHMLTLDPASAQADAIEVVVPALEPGVCKISVDKNGTLSNTVAVPVVPPVKVLSARLGSNNLITIAGKNFGAEAYFAENGSGLGVTVNGVECDLLYWTEDIIVALPRTTVNNLDTVLVKGFWGSDAAPVKARSKSRRKSRR
ncbi:MAG: IPT/TIG domain-containing protein [Deferrisomatales bacterium]